MRHAREEYRPQALGQSGSPHYPVEPARTGVADSTFNSTAQESDPGAKGMASEPNLTTNSNEMFLED